MTAPYDIVCSADDEAEWLKHRLTGIGASECAVVLGLSPYKSPYALWAEKCGLVEPDDLSEKEAVYWGKKLEDVILLAYGERTDRPVFRWQTMLRSKEWPWLTCTPDGKTGDGQDLWPLQIKTANARFEDNWSAGPPPVYLAQVQHEMLVTGAEKCTVACLLGGQKLVWCDVERDNEFGQRIVAKTREFWRMVQEREAPPIDGSESCHEALSKMYPAGGGDAIALPGATQDLLYELLYVQAQGKVLEHHEKELKNQLRALLGNSERGVLPSGWAISWKQQTRESYVVPASTSRVLRTHKPKK